MPSKKQIRGSNLTDKHVGTQLRMRRLMLGMTQTELGESVGVSFQQIQKYEKGTNRVSSSRLQQFSNILRTPVTSFFDGAANVAKGEVGLPVAWNEFFATADGLSLARSFMKIKNAKTRRQIVGLVEDIVRLLEGIVTKG